MLSTRSLGPADFQILELVVFQDQFHYVIMFHLPGFLREVICHRAAGSSFLELS